jgi:Tol biopolymer transport system component
VAFNNLVDDNNDIYVKELPNGPVDRITTDPAQDQRPFWTPDGQRLLYFTQRGSPVDRSDLTSVELDGLGSELILTSPAIFAEGSSSPGTEWLALRSGDLSDRGMVPGIWALRLGEDSVPVPLVNHRGFRENFPAISPDGRWLTYLSDRTGTREVYVRPFPGLDEGPGVRVSSKGGLSPRWAPSGRELLFLRPDGVMVSTDFDPGTGAVSGPRDLFTLPDDWTSWAPSFEVAPDGRLLMLRPRAEDASSGPRFVVVRNFESDLGRRDAR